METDAFSATTLCRALLGAGGMDEEPASRTAWALVTAEVWGRPSHGLLRLPYYLERFRAGGTDPAADLRVVRDGLVTTVLDGGNGVGHWQLWEASVRASERATRHGLAAVSVANSGHCGVLGLYVLPMVTAGLVGMAFSNGPAVMPAMGGDRPILSTSPIAAGIPLAERASIIDLATSTVSRGRIANLAASGKSLPDGWAFDATGAPTVDAHLALSGMLAPMGGAKGFALAFLVEALTGGVVGPHLATEIADPLSAQGAGSAQRVSHLVVALDPASLDGDGRARERLERLAQSVTHSGGRIPGGAHPTSDEIADTFALNVPDPLARTLVNFADDFGVAVPDGFARV